MNKIYSLFYLITMLAIVVSCNSDDDVEKIDDGAKGFLSISSCEAQMKTKNGTSYELSDVTSVIVTIEKEGTVMKEYNRKEISLGNWSGGSFMIPTFELECCDNYKIIAFELLNSDKVSTFAAPIEGSEAAAWVNEPLPFTFAIHSEETTETTIEVVSTLGSTPETFGYASFGVSDKTPKVQQYLENFEAVFTVKNDSVVHHFTKRGIPTYSDVYRRHAINTHQILNYVKTTYKHYYLDDHTLINQIDAVFHNSSTSISYNITEHYESGEIKKFNSEHYQYVLNENGNQTEQKYIENGMVVYRHVFTYDGNNNLITGVSYNSIGDEIEKNVFTRNSEGYPLTKEVTSSGVFYKHEYVYDTWKKLEEKTFRAASKGEELKLSNKKSFEYNSDDCIVKEIHGFEDKNYKTITYQYEGESLVSSIVVDIQGDEHSDYFDELGFQKNEGLEIFYDYRGRIRKQKYIDDEFTVERIYDSGADLRTTKYIIDGICVKEINHSSNKVFHFRENGSIKTATYYVSDAPIMDNSDEPIQLVLDVPITAEEVNALQFISAQYEYDENNEKKSYIQAHSTIIFETNYLHGKSVKEKTYSLNYSSYIPENPFEGLESYHIVDEDLVTGEKTENLYDKYGNIIG